MVQREQLYVDRFLLVMARQPQKSTRKESSAASDVYKRQGLERMGFNDEYLAGQQGDEFIIYKFGDDYIRVYNTAVSYTHLRAHETPEHLVCRLLLEKKKDNRNTPRLPFPFSPTPYAVF
ncbi:hypothetical protein CDFC105_30021 [Clostridioides difficile]|nr:hypothetical protein CDFC105_30021 [Clostridioides difficile]